METPTNYTIPTPDPSWDYYDAWMVLLEAQTNLNVLIQEIGEYENSTLLRDKSIAWKLDRIGLALRAKAGDLDLGHDHLVDELIS